MVQRFLMDIVILASFFLYFGILFGISFYFYLGKRRTQDFFLGGRSTNYFVTAIAAQAADMSSWLFLGFPASIYCGGLPSIWIAIGLVLFMFLNWHFVAPRLRMYTEASNSMTLSSFFAHRLQDKKGILRLVSAFFSLLFFAFYIAAGLVGLGRMVETVFGLSYRTGLGIGLLGSVFYTFIGGFLAVAWCNLFQGLFLLCVIVAVPAYAFTYLSGVNAIITAAQAQGVSLNLFSGGLSFFSIINFMAWGIGYFGQPHIITYFMAIDDRKKIHYAKYVGISWQIVVLAASAMVGLIGLALLPSLANPELIFIVIAQRVCNPMLIGLILCSMLAAVLSTLNSQILFSASVIAEDVYAYWLFPQATAHQAVLAARMGTLAIGFGALAIAWQDSSTVFRLVEYAWSGLGSSFGPLVILSLYGNKIRLLGALVGMISGGMVSALWPYFNSFIMPIVPGFCSGLIIMYGVSCFQYFTTDGKK